MKIHSTVLVILHSPREKVWGQLLDLNPAGVTIHGLDLNAFDEWLKQWGIGGRKRFGDGILSTPQGRAHGTG